MCWCHPLFDGLPADRAQWRRAPPDQIRTGSARPVVAAGDEQDAGLGIHANDALVSSLLLQAKCVLRCVVLATMPSSG